MKDYYAILGVDRDTPEDEVKTAYKNLAKKYHPDINKGADAEDRFKEINEAYEAIKSGKADVPQGPHHNPWGSVFDHFDMGGRPMPAAPSYNPIIELVIDIDFLDACFGTKKKLEYQIRGECKTCEDHKKQHRKYNRDVCSVCAGSGQIVRSAGNFHITSTCGACRGTGGMIKCDTCHGNAFIMKEKKISVTIPVGTNQGSTLRISNGGHYDRNSGGFGDLYLHVNVLPHPEFARDGDDIHSRIDIDYLDCILGGKINTKTIHGETEVIIPEYSDSGNVLRLQNMGVKKEGHHFLTIRVKMPTALYGDERKILEDLNKYRKDNSNN